MLHIESSIQQYLWVNPACISLLEDWTRQLVWWIMTNGNPEKYHTIRWFADHEKKEIEKLHIMKSKHFNHVIFSFMLTNDRTPWLDLAVFNELGDNNAREYIRLKYGNETEQQAMKALEQFDHDMRETEAWQNMWVIYRRR